MKLKHPATLALLFATVMSGVPQVRAAATGTINVTALITSPTCQVDVNGSANAVVTLPDVSADVFKKVGGTAGRTPIKVNVTECGNIAAGALEIVISKNVATAGMEIPVTGSARNAVFALAKDNYFVSFGSPAGSQKYPVTLSGGKGSVEGLELFYYATALPVLAGKLTGKLTVSMQYK